MTIHAGTNAGHHRYDPLHPSWQPPQHPPPPATAHRPPPGHQSPPGHPEIPTDLARHHTADDPDDLAGHRHRIDLRRQVAYRAKRLNHGHLVEADLRYGTRDALGPHAVMLFFTTPAPAEPHGYRLHTSYRLFLASPEAEDLTRLLHDLTTVARTAITHAAARGHRWHPHGPRAAMVNGGDMTLPPHAHYIGTGVSTLDTDDGRWDQLARSLRIPTATGLRRSAWDLKGQCHLLLTDGTAMHIDRNPHARLGDDGIRSSTPLDPIWNPHWHNPHRTLTEQGDHATRHRWRHLTALHTLLTTHLHPGRPA